MLPQTDTKRGGASFKCTRSGTCLPAASNWRDCAWRKRYIKKGLSFRGNHTYYKQPIPQMEEVGATGRRQAESQRNGGKVQKEKPAQKHEQGPRGKSSLIIGCSIQGQVGKTRGGKGLKKTRTPHLKYGRRERADAIQGYQPRGRSVGEITKKNRPQLKNIVRLNIAPVRRKECQSDSKGQLVYCLREGTIRKGLIGLYKKLQLPFLGSR